MVERWRAPREPEKGFAARSPYGRVMPHPKERPLGRTVPRSLLARVGRALTTAHLAFPAVLSLGLGESTARRDIVQAPLVLQLTM